MNSQLWNLVSDAFYRVMEQPVGKRAEFLESLSPEVRNEVVALLAAEEHSGDFLRPAGSWLAPGTTIGPYSLMEFVGRGGMGEVYRARHGDDFEHVVAVKVFNPLFSLQGSERLFARERRILAQLSHPNIVSMIDGGDSGGRQYLVMEWVDGLPLHQWAPSATLRQRLELFEVVCGAVDASHKQLIAHCDLKPSNILVTAAGHPKLLDFGIARLLGSGAGLPGEAPLTILPLTLEYASPEQARSLPAGVPSDIYTLGLILYELVCLRPAQQVRELPLDEAIHAITTVDLPRVPGMARDLESIIGKATAKEPARRYASASELADDVRRFLNGFPVRARPLTFSYQLSRFVRRNRTGVSLGIAAAAVVVVAFVAFVIQFQSAQCYRRLAEHRFQASLNLADLLMSSVPRRLSAVPGTVETRRYMAEESTRYLERLSSEVGNDIEFSLTLAKGYRQIALQYFNTDFGNLNDPAAALKYLERAAMILEPLPPSAEVTKEWVLNRVARPYSVLGRREDALANDLAAEDLVKRLVATGDPASRLLEDRVLHNKAGNPLIPVQEQISLWKRLENRFRERVDADPSNQDSLRNLGLVHKNLSGVYTLLKQWDSALEHDRKALDLDQRRHALTPQNSIVRMDLSFSLGRLGQDLTLSGRRAEGIAYLRRAVEIRRELVAVDARDGRAHDRLAWMLGELGHALIDDSQVPEGVRYIREALAIHSKNQSRGYAQNSVPHLHYVLAVKAEKEARMDEACIEWRAAVAGLRSNDTHEFEHVFPVEQARQKASDCNQAQRVAH